MVGGSMSTYRFLPSLYINEHITEVAKKKWFISHGLPVRNCYAIILAHHSQCALEIMTVEELHKKFRKREHYDVVGLSNSRHGAFTLLERIYADTYANTGDYSVKAYLQSLME